MAPSTDEYAISIKTEIEIFDENVTLKSEEKYDALDVGVSENNTQEVDEELYCGLCGGRFINTMDYFGVEDLKVICYCENNEFNAIHGEDVSQDLKVSIESTSDSKDILVDTNEDMSSLLNGKEFSNGNEHGVIHTPEQVDKEYQNEGTDLKSLRNRNTGKTPIQYESCTKNLTAKRNLRSRKKDHDEEPKVNSKICTRSSVNKSGVTNNLKTHTEVKYPLQCDMCPKSFLQSSVLKHHEKSHTWEHLFQSQKRNLKCYKKNCARKNPVQCEIYSETLTKNNDLVNREKTSTTKSPFQCEICLKTFTKKHSLRRHERLHAEQKSFRCKFCSKAFTRNYRLKYHELTHTGESQFRCKICLKTFDGLYSLKCHEMTHTEEKLFRCNYCSKLFNTMSNLKRHKKIHSEEKPFHCETCSKTFTLNSNLIQHEKAHRAERPFLCKFCSKTFNRDFHLKRHEKTHIGEKRFHCRVCSESFVRMASLIAHGKGHIWKGPFQCGICSKTFIKKEALIRHGKIHTGEKPFQCKVCSKAFSRSDVLKTHEKVHTAK